MTVLFRHDLSDLDRLVPHVIDARNEGTFPEGAQAWVQAATRPVTGRWIGPPGAAEADATLLRAGETQAPPDRPLYCEDVAGVPEDHPGPIILMRLASYPCAAEQLLATLDRMQDDPRLLLETSGASIAYFVTVAATRFPERVLFGSGGPVFDPRAQLRHVAAALPDDGVLRQVLHGNAARWLGEI